MGKINFLVFLAIFISISSLKFINGAAIADSKADLESKLSAIIKNVNIAEAKLKDFVVKERNLQILEMDRRIKSENTTFLNDLQSFKDNRTAAKIQDKNKDCLFLAVTYKRYKEEAFTKYSHCLQYKLDIATTKCDVVLYEKFPFLEEMYATKTKLKTCLDLKKKDSSQANQCLNELEVKINDAEEHYEMEIYYHNFIPLLSNPYNDCDDLYRKRTLQLKDRLQECLN